MRIAIDVPARKGWADAAAAAAENALASFRGSAQPEAVENIESGFQMNMTAALVAVEEEEPVRSATERREMAVITSATVPSATAVSRLARVNRLKAIRSGAIGVPGARTAPVWVRRDASVMKSSPPEGDATSNLARRESLMPINGMMSRNKMPANSILTVWGSMLALWFVQIRLTAARPQVRLPSKQTLV